MKQRNHKKICNIDSKRSLQGWIINIRQHNWRGCVDGPKRVSDHGKQNVNNPCHGIKKVVRSGAHPVDINSGDIVFARRAVLGKNEVRGPEPNGLVGIWRFHDYSKILNEQVPWDDDPENYKFILYCREDPEVPREFEQPIQENFASESIPFHQTDLNISLKRLTSSEKHKYTTHLLEQNVKNDQVKDYLQELTDLWK